MQTFHCLIEILLVRTATYENTKIIVLIINADNSDDAGDDNDAQMMLIG